MPQEIFNYPELLKVLLPIIRADFRLLGTFDHNRVSPPLKQALTIFGGVDDKHVSTDDLEIWKNYTVSGATFYHFSGSHFYLNDHGKEIVKIMNETINNYQRQGIRC